MKHSCVFLAVLLLGVLLSGCQAPASADLAATTLPVYEFTTKLCQGTGLTVTRLVTENVSCLHDYTLQVHQMRAIQGANAVIISGAGLEEFLEDALTGANHVVDASQGIPLYHRDGHHQGHSHDADPHIWLSPAHAKEMSQNICRELSSLYPEHKALLSANLDGLLAELDALQSYGDQALGQLSCRELITFHDGFSYLADSFHLTILKAVEEESGSEASARQLKELILLTRQHQLPALFTEKNASARAATIISAETGTAVFSLDMAMSGSSYLEAMYQNIQTLQEALQ